MPTVLLSVDIIDFSPFCRVTINKKQTLTLNKIENEQLYSNKTLKMKILDKRKVFEWISYEKYKLGGPMLKTASFLLT